LGELKVVELSYHSHIALDARTGKVVWDTKVANSELGYGYTSGPIVARGKVIAGMSGCSRYKDDVCFISGYDAATGKEVWRTFALWLLALLGIETLLAVWVGRER